jgi:hypothetical protein
MSEFRIAQMITDQLTNVDPFAQAQAMKNPAGMSQPDQQIMGGGPFESQALPAFKNQQVVQPEVAAKPVESIIPSGNASQAAAFGKSALPKSLQKMGVDDKGLALNEMGRIQLIGRLRKKYGDRYNQVPEALDALSMFDKAMSEFPGESRKSMNRTVANGERTLKALLGGT